MNNRIYISPDSDKYELSIVESSEVCELIISDESVQQAGGSGNEFNPTKDYTITGLWNFTRPISVSGYGDSNDWYNAYLHSQVTSGNPHNIDLTDIGESYASINYWSKSGSDISYSTGGVGIGTDSPSFPLHVYGNIVGFYDNTPQALNTGGTIVLGGKYTDTGTYTGSVAISAKKESSVSGENGFALAFVTRKHGEESSEKVRILGNGNVGIGTKTPWAKITTSGTYHLQFYNPDGTANKRKFYIAQGADHFSISAQNDANSWVRSLMRFDHDGGVEIYGYNGSISADASGAILSFSRGGANYIWAKTAGGDLHFGTNGLSTDPANASLSIGTDKSSKFRGNLINDNFSGSGLTSTGWTITQDGEAILKSLTVRETFTVFQLKVEEVKVAGSSQMYTEGAEIYSVDANRLYYNKSYSIFSVNQVIRCQQYNPIPKYYQIKVSSVGVAVPPDGTDPLGYVEYVTKSGGSPSVNDNIVRVSGDVLEASSRDGGFLQVASGISNVTDSFSTEIRYGNVAGLSSNNTKGSNASGYGLWHPNFLIDDTGVYLKGDIKADSGYFKGDLTGASGTFSGALSGATISGGTITIGSGNSVFKADSNGIYLGNATFGSAPFRVDLNGNMTALAGTFGGSLSGASGTFSGSLSGATGTFSGALSGATGTFSGALSGGTISIGSSNSIFKADTNGIYLGNSIFSSAPFRVDTSGAMTATSGYVGGFEITGTTISSGIDGAFLGNSGIVRVGAADSTITMSVDSSIGEGFWAGSRYKSTAPFSVGLDGSLVATSGTLGSFLLDSNKISTSTLEIDATNNRIRLSNSGTLYFYGSDFSIGQQWGYISGSSSNLRIKATASMSNSTGFVTIDGLSEFKYPAKHYTDSSIVTISSSLPTINRSSLCGMTRVRASSETIMWDGFSLNPSFTYGERILFLIDPYSPSFTYRTGKGGSAFFRNSSNTTTSVTLNPGDIIECISNGAFQWIVTKLG